MHSPSAAGAIRDFLVALGLDPAEHTELAQTPELVARAWRDELLDGYRADPRQLLAERMPAPNEGQLVSLANLEFQSVCPHHLLPYAGVAHLAYLPGEHIVGFGQLVRLLDCLGHRLVLQETLAKQLADTLVTELGAKGAAVMLTAAQGCLCLRGPRRQSARVSVEAFAGAFQRDEALRARWLETIRGAHDRRS